MNDDKCQRCDGNGHTPHEIAGRRYLVECEPCGGSGRAPWWESLPTPALVAEFSPITSRGI